jgi:hypothetical protein
MNRGAAFLFEVHGDQGDLHLTAASRASMQRQELNVRGARGNERNSLSCPYQTNTAGFRKGLLGVFVTLS